MLSLLVNQVLLKVYLLRFNDADFGEILIDLRNTTLYDLHLLSLNQKFKMKNKKIIK